MECPDGYKNWWKFIVFGFAPLTFFFLIILFFNINVTSSHLHGVVFFSQCVSLPQFVCVLLLVVEPHPKVLKLANTILPLYSFWNPDLFRSLYPNICLNVNMLQALALEYSTAVYPLFLIFISYVFVVLYDNKIGLPFYRLFSLIRTNWNVRTSVIDSFAAFFLLSYVKILSSSVDLLVYSPVYKYNSTDVSYRLYYDPSATLFGPFHMLFLHLL